MAAKARIKRLEAALKQQLPQDKTIGIQGEKMPESDYIDYRLAISDLEPIDDEQNEEIEDGNSIDFDTE